MKKSRSVTSLSIGDNLQIVRKKNQISQSQIAKILGVHTVTYSKYERNKQIPDAAFILKFCDTFKVSPTWLLTGQGPMQMPDNPAGVETKLLEKLITKVKEHLDESDYVISPAKKAEIISILYEEAVGRDDWREHLSLDRRSKRFIDLIASFYPKCL